MGVSLKEIQQAVQDKGKVALKAIQAAFDLIESLDELITEEMTTEQLKPTKKKIRLIDQALEQAHLDYLDSVEAFDYYQEAIEDIKSNQDFMKEEENRDFVRQLEDMMRVSKDFNDGLETMLLQYEEQLLRMKDFLGLTDEELDKNEGDKKRKKKAKCRGCTMM